MAKCKLWIMVGIAGSGKSTWIGYNDWRFDNPKFVSRDKIRFSLLKDGEDYFSKEKETWREFLNQIKDGVENYTDVVIDATHFNAKSRAKLFNALKRTLKDDFDNTFKYAVVIKTDIERAIERDSKREGRAHVGAAVIKSMAESFEIPSIEEGFDKIYVFNNNTDTDGYGYKCDTIEARRF